jgi:hypothetical protein
MPVVSKQQSGHRCDAVTPVLLYLGQRHPEQILERKVSVFRYLPDSIGAFDRLAGTDTLTMFVTAVPSFKILISSSKRYPFHLGKRTVQLYQYRTPNNMLQKISNH